jgi:hypothetical protein
MKNCRVVAYVFQDRGVNMQEGGKEGEEDEEEECLHVLLRTFACCAGWHTDRIERNQELG